MNIIIILIVFLLLINIYPREKFNNSYKLGSRKKLLEDYLKDFNCKNLLFKDNHPEFNYNENEIKHILKIIINKLNNKLNMKYEIFEILEIKKYLGNYYNIKFSCIDNHFVNNFEIKYNFTNNKLNIYNFYLLNSNSDNNLNGYDNINLINTNSIGKTENYSWMFDLSNGDMGMIPHSGNNRN